MPRLPSNFPDGSVSCSLREPGARSLDRVAAPEERRRREARIETWHREGWRRAPGGQARGQADDTDSVRWVDGLERAQELARLPGQPGGEGPRPRGRRSGADLACGAALLVRASRWARRRMALASGKAAELRDHVLETDPVGGQ